MDSRLFEDSEFQAAPAASGPLPEQGSLNAVGLVAAPGMALDDDFVAAYAENGDANGAPPLAGQESTEDAFFTHYVAPALSEHLPILPEPPASVVDARTELRKANEAALSKREAEEKKGNEAVLTKAKEVLAKFAAERNTLLGQRKLNNRKKESVVKQSETPSAAGSNTWEIVSSMINFSSTTGHTKDLTRFKGVLSRCKANNVAIKA